MEHQRKDECSKELGERRKACLIGWGKACLHAQAAAIRTLTQTGITTEGRPPEGQRIPPRVRTVKEDTGSPIYHFTNVFCGLKY
ncbi:hypothetical protein Tco_1001715 [Tanacetum coccineum]